MLSWVPHLVEEVAPLLRAQVEDAQTPPREPVSRDDPVGGVLLLVLDNFFKNHQMWGSKEKLSLESQHWRLERGYSLLQSLINRVPNPHGHILGALRDLCASPEESTVDTLSMDVHVQNIQQASHRAMGLVEFQYSELAVQVEASLTRDIKVLEETKLAEATAHLEALEKVDIQRKRDALNHARICKRKVAQKEDLQVGFFQSLRNMSKSPSPRSGIGLGNSETSKKITDNMRIV